jgi:hypothetical protein
VFDRELEIEFVVPPVFREDRNANRRYAAIVVAWVPNGYASMVEVVDAAGVRAPTLSAAEANKLQVEIILALAQDLLKASPPPSLRVAIEETIRTGSVTPFARSEAWRDMFAGQLRDTRRGPETAERLVKALLEATRSEPVVLELDAEREDRRLVRLSYRMHVSKTLPKSVHIGQWERIRRTLGWSETRYLLPLDERDSASYELRTEVPDGIKLLRISMEAKLQEDGRTVDIGSAPVPPDAGVARISVPPGVLQSVIEFVVRPNRAYPLAVFLAAALSAVVLGADFWRLSTLARAPEAASAILLALPALITTLVAQPGRGTPSATLLRGARGVLGLCGLLTYAAAVMLVLFPSDKLGSTAFLRVFWLSDTALCGLLAVMLVTPVLGPVLDTLGAVGRRLLRKRGGLSPAVATDDAAEQAIGSA